MSHSKGQELSLPLRAAIVTLHGLYGWSFRQIGKELDIRHQTVNNVFKHIEAFTAIV